MLSKFKRQVLELSNAFRKYKRIVSSWKSGVKDLEKAVDSLEKRMSAKAQLPPFSWHQDWTEEPINDEISAPKAVLDDDLKFEKTIKEAYPSSLDDQPKTKQRIPAMTIKF